MKFWRRSEAATVAANGDDALSFGLMAEILAHFAIAASAAEIAESFLSSPAATTLERIRDGLQALGLQALPVQVPTISAEDLPCLTSRNATPSLISRQANGQVLRHDMAGVEALELRVAQADRDIQGWRFLKTNDERRSAATRLRNINPLANLGISRIVWILVAAFGSNVLGLATSLFVMVVYDRVLPNKAVESLYSLAIGVGLAVLFDTILRNARAKIVDRAGLDADSRVTEDIFDQFVAASSGPKRKSVGELASIMRNYEIFREFMTTAMVLTFVDLPFVFLYIFVIWKVSGLLFLVPLIALPVMLVIVLAVQPLMARSSRDATQIAQSRQGLLVEVLSGLDALRVTGAFALMKQRFLMQANQQRLVTGKSRDFSQHIGTVISVVQQAVQVATIVLGFHLFTTGEITMGAIIAAVILSGRAMGPLARVGQTMGRANMALSAYRSLTDFLAAEANTKQAVAGLQTTAGAAAIEISNVTLRLDPNAAALFDGLSLRIMPGERVAVLGRTGSGKSTLVRLINGLLQPESGVVLLGGVPVSAISRAHLPQIIGTVFQQPWLFAGTLRDNIGLGRAGMSEAAIAEALATVGLAGEGASKELSLSMPISEQGANLSGGQRQAITVARALVSAPDIFLMDEPSSAMDSQLEALLIRQIKTRLQGKTLVMVTHKAKLLELCDRVVLVDRGRILRDISMQDYIAGMITARKSGKTAPPEVDE